VKRHATILPAILLMAACTATETDTGSNGEAEGVSTDANAAIYGGCIQRNPVGEVPEDVYEVSEVVASDAYPPFTKTLTVAGLVLAAGDDASDDFMQLVSRAISEIFAQNEGLDLEMQAEILRNHYRYNSVIPVPVGEDFSFFEHPDFEQTASENSICDIIMQDIPGQVMEVVEHILHYVSDMGLSYAFPEDWGFDEGSMVSRGMRKAIEMGYYDVTQYEGEGRDGDEQHRVLVQEFAYWIISTYWDLQEAYGPVGEAEWTISTSADLAERLPAVYAMIERTVGRTMMAPSLATLQEIGPTRAEERAARGAQG
jgi:hypothetical protein